MPRVICEIPGTAPDLDGLEWTADRGQLISPEISEAAATRYAGIPGFRLVEPPPAPVNPPAPPVTPPPSAAERQPAAEGGDGVREDANADEANAEHPPGSDAEEGGGGGDGAAGDGQQDPAADQTGTTGEGSGGNGGAPGNGQQDSAPDPSGRAGEGQSGEAKPPAPATPTRAPRAPRGGRTPAATNPPAPDGTGDPPKET